MKKIIIFFIFFVSAGSFYAQNTVSISGQVTDFEGNPIDSSVVQLLSRGFEVINKTYSDKNGYYKLENVDKGKYMAMYVIRPKEYPRQNAVPEKDMRLEFWAWNIIADKDLAINPRYQKLELYGTTVFEIYGGYKGLFVYFRPMSLTKNLSYGKGVYLDKNEAEKKANISVKPEYLDVKIFADEELLKINSVQPIEEFIGDEKSVTGYIVQVDIPKINPANPYVIFRVEAENKEYREKGENLYFYELPIFRDKLNEERGE